MANWNVHVEFDHDHTRSQVAALLRRVAEQIEEGYSSGIAPRFTLHAPQIDALEDENA